MYILRRKRRHLFYLLLVLQFLLLEKNERKKLAWQCTITQCVSLDFPSFDADPEIKVTHVKCSFYLDFPSFDADPEIKGIYR